MQVQKGEIISLENDSEEVSCNSGILFPAKIHIPFKDQKLGVYDYRRWAGLTVGQSRTGKMEGWTWTVQSRARALWDPVQAFRKSSEGLIHTRFWKKCTVNFKIKHHYLQWAYLGVTLNLSVAFGNLQFSWMDWLSFILAHQSPVETHNLFHFWFNLI